MKLNKHIKISIAAALLGAALLCACGTAASVPAETPATVTETPAAPQETQAAKNVNEISFRFADAQ